MEACEILGFGMCHFNFLVKFSCTYINLRQCRPKPLNVIVQLRHSVLVYTTGTNTGISMNNWGYSLRAMQSIFASLKLSISSKFQITNAFLIA